MTPSAQPQATLFRRARLVTRDRVLEPWALLARDGRIAALMPDAEADPPPGAESVDLAGRTLCPGFIDIHVHGIGPDHMMRADRFPAMMRAMAAGGATGCLPSVGMFRPPQYAAYLEAVARYQAAPAPGCLVLGAHFESPYLNPDCICIEPDFLWAPRPDEYRRWLEVAPGALRLMTLSPELPGAFELIQDLTARGVTASIGHSLATAEQLARAMAAGHGGGDFFVMHHFAEAIRTRKQPYLDVTRGVAMSIVGIQAYRSALNHSNSEPVPDFRLEPERVKYENDNWSPDPARRGPGQPWPSVEGDLNVSPQAVRHARKQWKTMGYTGR